MIRSPTVRKIEILAFILLTVCAAIALVPISRAMDKALDDVRIGLVERLESETGLRISYESMSPSILKSIRIKNLVVSDASDSSVVASVSKVSVSYDLFALIRGDVSGMLKEIVLEDGSLGIDRAMDSQIISRLRSLGSKRGKEIQGGGKGIPPLRVRLKNLDLSFRDGSTLVMGTIVSGSLAIDGSDIAFRLNSRVSVNARALSKFGPLSSRLMIDGTINRSYDVGSARLTLSSLEGKFFMLSRLGLVASMRDGVVSVSSIQDLQPMDLKLSWDRKENSVNGSFNCDGLYPLRWIRIHDGPASVESLRDSVFTGSADFDWNETDGISYRVSMDSAIPGEFLGGGEVRLACSGTDKALNLKEFAVIGPRYDISYSGTVDLKRLLPDGFLSVRRMVIPNGVSIAGDMYIERKKNRVTAIMPSLTFDTAVFSGIELKVENNQKVWDFSLSAHDPSGTIGAEGSFSRESGNFIQFIASFDSIDVSNALETVLGFAIDDNPRLRSSLVSGFQPYKLTTEAYFSSDFSNLSFNCNKVVFASAQKDGLYVLLSVKGTRKGIDVTDIDFAKAGYAIAGNVYIGIDTGKSVLFESSLEVNSLPYNLHGMYANKTLSFYGDYGIALSLVFEDPEGMSGSLRATGMPIPAGPALFALSLDAGFSSNRETGWKISLNDCVMEEMKGFLPLASVIDLKGEITASGVFFDRVSLTDSYSTIQGHAGLNAVPGTEGESRFAADVALENKDTGESFSLTGQILQTTELFLDFALTASDIPLMRFLKGQQRENLASLQLTCSGTPQTLLASADIKSLSYRLGNFDLDTHAKLMLEDRSLSVFDAGGSWNGNILSDVKGSLELDTMLASVTAQYNNVLGNNGIDSKIDVRFTPGERRPLETYGDLASLLSVCDVSAVFSDVTWRNVAFSEPVTCSIVREPGITALYAGKNDSVSGYLLDDGTFSLEAGKDFPITFKADGSIVGTAIDVAVSGLHAEMTKIWPFTGFDVLAFPSGTVDGSLRIQGLLYDPDFTGDFTATNVQLAAPGTLDGTYAAESFEIIAREKRLTAGPFLVSGKEGSMKIDASVEFDRWFPKNTVLNGKTLPGDRIRLKADTYFFKASGLASCDLQLTYDAGGIGLTGDVLFERGSFAVLFTNFYKKGDSSFPYEVNIDLGLSIGKKVEFRWPSDDLPILRGLVQADDPFRISLNTASGTYRFKGTADLKGGEIFYAKRSFYLRKGQISFNENQDSFNPYVILNAEIREQDEEGEPVRILLTVDNQPLLSFVPVISTDPPKSNAELMILLGQAVVADSNQTAVLRNVVVSASDVLTQMGVFRNVENIVRDGLNLDIFSIRTLLLQNALFGSSMQGEPGKTMTFGNYFDNTTVYMGKYFGSAIYGDVLMHFNYFDPINTQRTGNKNLVLGNLLFQPEIGVEVNTPLFLLRWGLSPSSLDTLFVADNSITLSWKFSY